MLITLLLFFFLFDISVLCCDIFCSIMLNYYSKKLKFSLQLLYFLSLAITCVLNYLNAPTIICLLSECKTQVKTDILAMFSRSIAITCLIGRITIMYKNMSDFPNYLKKIEEYELHYPVNSSNKNHHRFISIAIILAYIVIILPINVLRIYLIYSNYANINAVFFYSMMYAHNWSICSTEIHFIVRCIGLYQKFQLINEEMATLKLKTIIENQYPVVLQSDEGHSNNNVNAFIGLRTRNDGLPPSTTINRQANRIEHIRMKHQFVREIVVELNDLYGIQLGLSICLLFIMTLFDIYEELSIESNVTKTKVLLYGWLLQYSFRFCAIVLTTHITTIQVRIPYLIIISRYNS